jgi:hypothetical protein
MSHAGRPSQRVVKKLDRRQANPGIIGRGTLHFDLLCDSFVHAGFEDVTNPLGFQTRRPP